MASIDYVNSLGAGAGIDTKALVNSLVEAERAGSKQSIDRKIVENETAISGLAVAVSQVSDLRLAAIKLNDVTDFNNYSVNNSQSTALSVSAGGTADAGTHTITVTSPAKAQASNSLDASTSGPTVGFTSGSQAINGGNAFDMTITIGTSSTASTTFNVATATPDGVVNAINGANLGVTAQLVALDTSGSNYTIQLTGQTGLESAFSVTESVSELNFATPSGFSAADADLTVNGIQYSRANNSIDDIIKGVTLDLTSSTSGAATISINRDTSTAKSNIEAFVATYNSVNAKLKELTSSAQGGELAGDSIVRRIRKDIQNIVLQASSTPGNNLTRLSDMGLEVTKTGDLEINNATLTSALANNFSDVVTMFSADTNNDSEIGEAKRGIAGDLSMLIKGLTSSTGYFTTQTNLLTERVSEYNQDLTDLETRLSQLEKRYTQQFLSMQIIVDEMNATKDSLKSSFENLPYNNRNQK